VALFMDIEFVSIQEAEPPDAYAVAFDVIYAGETWCRSLVGVDAAAAARMGRDEYEVIRAARGALLDHLAVETVPVSLHLRLDVDGVTVLARGRPGA
jgi:hypothetical protein